MRKHNRTKDILINHVFDHCYNEVVQKIDSPGSNITIEDPHALKDLAIKALVDQVIKSGNVRGYYTTRDKEYCKILIDDNTVHRSLIIKLNSLGISKGRRLYSRIEKAHNELLASSYLARNNPIKDEVKLTEKGLRHYLDGKSFEDEFAARRNSIIAIIVSVFSILIALAALVFN